MPGVPRVFKRASKAASRRCNSAMVAFCSAMTATSASRLAVAKSKSMSMLLVYHNSIPDASNFDCTSEPIRLIKSEWLPIWVSGRRSARQAV